MSKQKTQSKLAQKIIKEGRVLLDDYRLDVLDENPTIGVMYSDRTWEKILESWREIQELARKNKMKVSRDFEKKCLVFEYRM